MPAPTRGNRSAAAVALRLAGGSYGEVAEALDFATPAEARDAVEAHLALRSGDAQTREQLRAEAVGRLERLLRGTWGKATNPDHPEHIPSAKFALAVVDRLIRLHGLDAPAEVVVHTPTMREIDEWVATLTTDATADLVALEDPTIVDAEVVGADA